MSTEKTDIITLAIEARGEIISSNFPAFAEMVRDRLTEINRDLKTDEDFDQADADSKAIASAETALKAAKEKALADAEQLNDLFTQIDALTGDLSAARLDLTKQIAKRKEEIKAELQAEYFGKIKCAAHVRRKVYLTVIQDAIKGKRTVETMRKALEIAVTVANGNIDLCRTKLDGHAEEHGAQSLPDRDDLETMAPAFLEAELRRRVEAVKAQEEAARLRKQAADAQAAADKAKRELAEASKPPLPPANPPPAAAQAPLPTPPKIGSIPTGSGPRMPVMAPLPQSNVVPFADAETRLPSVEWEAFKTSVFTSFGPLKAAKESLRDPGNIARAATFAAGVNAAWNAANAKEVAS